MDLSAGLMPHLCLGRAAFLSDEEIASLAEEALRTPEALQIDSFEVLSSDHRNGEIHQTWRVDGCDGQGTQFFALPVFLSSSLIPLRIDVFIPDQAQHPQPYRNTLGSSSSFCIRDKRVASLGISRLIVVALDNWTKSHSEFRSTYLNCPFGSRIVLENIDPEPQNIRIKLIPDFSVERQFLTVDALRGMWSLPDTSWPSHVSLESLKLVRQIHDTISVVQIPNIHAATEFVFKTTTGGMKFLYHELKLLLTIPSHPHIMPKPLYIVTRADRYTKMEKVYGFVLKYYQKGNLASLLATRIQEKSLKLSDQFRWARQIASTLSFIQKSPAKFYSELKVDNLLVTEDDESVVFIDFEQMGNWMTYSAPEIHYVEYLTRLVKAEFTPRSNKEIYQRVLDKSSIEPLEEDKGEEEVYKNPRYSYYCAWNSLTEQEQEAAMVYSLGMTLWCLFEGCIDTRNSVLKAFEYDSGLEYPQFQKTPPDMQSLILRCTKGSPYLRKDRIEVFRDGPRIFPRENLSATAVETLEAARGMWCQRISEAVEFLEARARWKSGIQKEDDKHTLGFMSRPSLDEVLNLIKESETRNFSQAD